MTEGDRRPTAGWTDGAGDGTPPAAPPAENAPMDAAPELFGPVDGAAPADGADLDPAESTEVREP